MTKPSTERKEKEATLNVDIRNYSRHKSLEAENKMKPPTIIYWSRFLLGVVAALICAFLSGPDPSFNILNGISIALLVYIVTYYVYKSIYQMKFEKRSKILTTGVGAYFLAWIVMWTLFYTVLHK